jgi:hypothetical protein
MSNFNDSRGYHENTKDSKVSDVGKLIRENASDAQVLAALRSKYSNDVDLINKLFSEYEQKMSRIRAKAQKFANLIILKYNHLGPKRIIEKAKKYKKKYDFSDDEFNAFLNIALSDKSFSSANVNIPNTELSRTLGYTADIPSKMMVKSSDLEILQDILRMNQENTQKHAEVVIQSLTYNNTEECKIMLSSPVGEIYDTRKDNMYSNIHPVLFALFAPKIKDLEDRMLLASISSIVSSRYNGTQFKTQPDWLLYHDLIQDPNESVCVSSQKDSALVNLRNRIRVQVELWKSVSYLRQGKFYPNDATNFLVALKACKNTYYDSPDLAFVEDEGSVLRRLLSVFSYRPTIVAVQNPAGASPFAAGIAISSYAMSQVTTIPIINIRLPLPTMPGSTTKIALATQLSAPDFYVENKIIVPKIKSVVHSRDVLLFYINRRLFNLDHSKLVNPSMLPSFNVLPFSISGYEKINETKVDLTGTIGPIGNTTYSLKSIVSVDTATFPAPPGAPSGTPITTFIKGCKATVKCGTGGSAIATSAPYNYLTNVLVTYNPLNIDNTTKKVTPLEAVTAGNFSDYEDKVTIAVFVKP